MRVIKSHKFADRAHHHMLEADREAFYWNTASQSILQSTQECPYKTHPL